MRFLIVEDDTNLNNILFDYIKNKYKDALIDQVYDGIDAIIKITEHTYHLVLLDVMLPNIGGFEICKKLRESSNVPVIMLSALSDEDNQLKGYNLGIDEYVTKPYSPKLVIKKIEAILSRSDQEVETTYGIIDYNLEKHQIKVNQEEVILNKKEWDLFQLFIQNKGIVFSREALLNKVWGYDFIGFDRTVDTHIKRLRQKLNDAAPYIKTVFKEGYKFEK